MNKKYQLKPGRHQFAPRSPAIHTNENLSDEEAEWYLQKYPHVAALFEPVSAESSEQDLPEEKSVKSTKIGEIQNNNESVQSIKIGETERSDLMNAAEKQ